jgi:hypothetical protein
MLAALPQEKCKAFTKDHRPCRLGITKGHTCDVHKNYFSQWFANHPALDDTYLRDTTTRIYKEYSTILFKGLLKPTETYIQSIPDSPFCILFYLKVCEIDGVNPLLNRALFKRVIRFYIHSFFSLYRNPDFNIWLSTKNEMHSAFSTLFSSPELMKEGFKYVIQSILVEIIRLYGIYRLDDDVIFRLSIHFFKIIYEKGVWRGLFMANDLKQICGVVRAKMIASFNPETVDFFLNTVIAYGLEENKTATRQALRDRCSIYKEGIMMAAWHPDRVDRLLKAGIEFDDM